MRVLTFLTLMLWAGMACGFEIQDPPPQIDVGDDLDLVVEGLDGDGLKTASIIFWPKDGVRCRGVRGWADDSDVTIAFRASVAGKYLIHVCAVVEGKLEHDDVEFIVGPQTPPLPERFLHTILVVEEKSGDRTGYLEVVYSQKVKDWLNRHGQQILSRDKDVKDPVTGLAPEDLVQWLKAAEGKSLPYLFFIDKGGELVWEGSVPKSEDVLLKLVQDYTEVSDE